jgi:hypothetical protein
MKSVSTFLVGCLALGASACTSPVGFFYTHTYQPLTTDFHATPVQQEHADDDVKDLWFYVRVVWGSNGLGDIAKEHGFETIHYADLETLVVLGIWRQEWAHVYGTRTATPAQPAQ